MLCPETWRFDPPKVRERTERKISPLRVKNHLDSNVFYHSVTVACPDNVCVPENVINILKSDAGYFKITDCSLADLITKSFIEEYLLTDEINCISINRRSEIDLLFAIFEKTKLFLHIDKITFGSLGLDGKRTLKGNFYVMYFRYVLKQQKMPCLKQPLRLQELAMSRFGDWVALQAEAWMVPFEFFVSYESHYAKVSLAHAIAQIQQLVECSVPYMIFDKLALEVIRALDDLLERTKRATDFRISMAKFTNKMNVGVTMTEVIMNRYLTYLAIDEVPKMMRTAFYKRLHHLSGLTYLDLGSLSGGWKTNEMEPSIINGLKFLHKLRHLCVSYDCTNGIIQCVAMNCPALESLDLSCSKSITNDSVDYIIKCRNLKNIQLYKTLVTLEGFTKLLLNLDKLEDIGRCDEIGRVLEYIDLTDSSAGPFALTKYESRYAPINHLALAVDMCPKIKKITVFHNSLLGDLTVLLGLPDLSELKLLSCDFYSDQIKQLIQVKGCNLVSLHLEHVDQIDLNALMYISQFCPTLEGLTLYNCTLIHHTSLYTRKLEILPFRNIRRLVCVAECTEEQFLFIMTNCQNIRFVHLGTAVQITDNTIDKLFDKNPLQYLEDFRIMQADFLTMASVEKILNNCMSLRLLAELECWSLLTDGDREYIKNYIKTNNLNINTTCIKTHDIINNHHRFDNVE